jgi:hypothetical protein
MKTVYLNLMKRFIPLSLVLFVAISACERSVDGLSEPTFTENPNVYIDGFSSGLEYYPFQGSKLNAFSVDNQNTYGNSPTSMRFDVPNVGDPTGAYAGAIFRDDNGGRNLSNYNALTFYIKASTASTINEIGFGLDNEDNKYRVGVTGGLRVATYWQKVIIPIPDASKLTQERGMFWYSAGPVDGNGFSFWIDEMKYENLGTIGQPRPYIENGTDNISSAFEGQAYTVSNVGVTFNVADIGDISVNASAAYFKFSSTDPAVAAINADGSVSIVGGGTATITAELKGVAATGSVAITSIALAPIPTRDAANVISIFSDAYQNSPVDYFNGYWAPWQTTEGQDDIDINGNKVIKYSKLNFVGIEFQGEKTVDASTMTHFHVDIYVENTLKSSDFIQVKLQDLGVDNIFGGNNDKDGTVRLSVTSTPRLTNGSWISADLALTRFTGLSTRSNLAQIVFITDGTIKNILVDNMYFYKE